MACGVYIKRGKKRNRFEPEFVKSGMRKTRSGVGETLLTRNWSVTVLSGSPIHCGASDALGVITPQDNQNLRFIETKIREVVMSYFYFICGV